MKDRNDISVVNVGKHFMKACLENAGGKFSAMIVAIQLYKKRVVIDDEVEQEKIKLVDNGETVGLIMII